MVAVQRIPGRSYADQGLALPSARPDPAAVQAAAALPKELAMIVRPQAAKQWWILPQLSQITPAYIEQTLRGALAGGHVQIWELFNLMEDTWPRLVKNLNEVKRAVIARDWQIKAWAEEDQPPTESAQERARLVSSAIWRMRPDPAADENAFEQTLYDILDAWGKGVSVLEINWEARRAGKLGDIFAPKSTAWVHPCCYAWSDTGRLGLRQELFEDVGTGRQAKLYNPSRYTLAAEQLVEFPEDKFLIATCKAKTGSVLGGALLRPLAWWWCAANFSASWLLNLAQIFGLPIRWANYEPQASAATINEICNMLENLGSAGWAAFPAGTTLELKEPGKTGDQSPQADLLDRANTNCDLIVLGQTLTSEMTDSGGSFAAAKVHSGVKEEVIEAAAGFAASVVNGQLVPSVLRRNYDDDEECPEFCPEPRKQKDKKMDAERIQILVNAGMKVPRDWLHKDQEIPIPQKGEEVIERQAAAGPRSMTREELMKFGETDSPDEESMAAMHAKDATDKLTENVLEDLTGVQAKWLGNVRPFFHTLIALAQSGNVSDADFVAALEAANKQMPELFKVIDRQALQRSLQNAMSAAVVNGAVRGHMERRVQ